MTPRYLTRFDSNRMSSLLTDVLVIGSGVAGLRAAIAAADCADVLLICKGDVNKSNTFYAQGGIAVPPLSVPGSNEAHIQDTMTVACGLANIEAIREMVTHASERMKELIDWGAQFDERDGKIAYTREGGHTQARVVHAQGDATGRELMQILVTQVKRHPRIRLFENCFVIDLLTHDERCVGVISAHPHHGHQFILAKQIVLATGGCGRVFRETTNPISATGDGHAMAFRAGARLQDMEMVQFHPTALYVAGASRALISEAVRGEGGWLVDQRGHRFMSEYDPQVELAPRDVVSRAILNHMAKTQSTSVYLDVRHFPRGTFVRRFPHITQLCAQFEIDIEKDLIPVRPAAHYMIGGVSVDLDGQTSIPGLFACGEVAATGIHGANRLASNSLLEGLVLGERTGRSAGCLAASVRSSTCSPRFENAIVPVCEVKIDFDDLQQSLRSQMWRNAGILRNEVRLNEAIRSCKVWARYLTRRVLDCHQGWETQNMLTVGLMTATAAQYRTESRGVHWREDYPEMNDQRWKTHITLIRHEDEIHILR